MTKYTCDVCGKEVKEYDGIIYYRMRPYELCSKCAKAYYKMRDRLFEEAKMKFLKSKGVDISEEGEKNE